MPSTRINGIDLYYERHGEQGEPLVFIHGYTGDITDWRFQVQEFSPTYAVLVMDLRGHGRSEASADRDAYTIEQMANDVEALIDEVAFDRYHLVGHSMGGAIAQEIALRNQERLTTLTLEDTGPQMARNDDEQIAKYTARRIQIALEEGMEALANRPSRIPYPPHLPKERITEERERLARMSVDGFVGAAVGLRNWAGTRDRLGSLHTPTLVVCGELDAALLKGSERLAELIPDATLEIVPEAGHSPQYERPELFNHALREHLAKNKDVRAT